ncbi:MAG: Asp-tRNA(Asn)/Glu-tRNA(Gln) amidotransferase GatCAB subunit B, partial [Pseudomonadota bacterium]
YSLPHYDAEILVTSRELADFFEECVKLINQPKSISNWIMGDIMRHLSDTRDIAAFPVKPKNLAAMLSLIDKGIISGRIAKTVFEEMRLSGKMPEVIVEEKGLVQVSDACALENMVREVLEANPKMVDDYRAGKDKVFGFLMGQVMKATRGKGNPQMLNEILRKKLEG